MTHFWNMSDKFCVLTWIDGNVFATKGMNYILKPKSTEWVELSSYDFGNSVSIVQVMNPEVIDSNMVDTYLAGSYNSMNISELYEITDENGNNLFYENNQI